MEVTPNTRYFFHIYFHIFVYIFILYFDIFILFHIYFYILNMFIQGTNSISILFYNLAPFKLKYLLNYLQIKYIKYINLTTISYSKNPRIRTYNFASQPD